MKITWEMRGHQEMAKRFIDTRLTKKAWFRKLSPKMRSVWVYLICECDHAGIWEVDEFMLECWLGEKVAVNEIVKVFGENVRLIGGDKLYLTSFVSFQYGELNPKVNAHRSVLNILSRHKIQPFMNPSGTLPGRDQDKDKDKDQDKVQEKGVGLKSVGDAAKFENRFKFDFENLFSDYPRFQKKQASLNLMAEKILDQKTYDEMSQAIKKYRKRCESDETPFSKILTFPNFFNEWRDWLDPKAGEGATSPGRSAPRGSFCGISDVQGV